MRSIALAMTWEHWRRNVWLTLGTIAGGTAILVIPFGPELMNPIFSNGRFIYFIPLLFAMIGQVVVALNTTHKNLLEFPQELYAKPVSTPTLVALRMSLAITAAVGMYLGQALLIWAASGVMIPLWWGPLLALVMAAAWTHALVWSLPGCALPQVITVFLAIFFCVAYYGRHVARLVEFGADGTEQNPSRVVMGLYAVGMVIAVALAYAMAVIGVRFDRRGDRISLARLMAWIGDRIYAVQRTDRPFRSARAAQFWFEWHRKGWVLPLLNLLALSMYAVCAMTKDVSLVDGEIFLWGLAFVNVVFFPILAALLVNTQERGGAKDLFWATRPVSDNTLLRVRLRMAIASLLASWGVWLAGLIVIYGLLWITGQIERLMTDLGNTTKEDLLKLTPPLTRYTCVILLYMWIVLGIIGSLHITGRKVVAALWFVPIVVSVVWTILVRNDLIPSPVVDGVQEGKRWVFGILCLAGTLLAYRAALLKGRITNRLAWIALGVYLTLSLLVVVLPSGSTKALIDQGVGTVILGIGLAALPLLPLALGPLAIAWNRHR